MNKGIIPMPDYSNDFGGKFANASHVTKPFVGIIERVERLDVDGQGKLRPVIFFDGHERGFVLNATRYNTVAEIAKSRDTDDWVSVKVGVRKGQTRYAGRSVDCVEFVPPPHKPAADDTIPGWN
jgi:hypothetical protein